MTVYCQAEDCKWNKNYECDRACISLDCDNECEDFESYLDDAEWKKPFWKRMINCESKQTYRVLYYGKEIEIKGRKFFVETQSDYASATDEITGLNCGKRCDLDSRIETIIERALKLNIPPLESLPIGELDEKTYKVKPKQDVPTEKGGAES